MPHCRLLPGLLCALAALCLAAPAAHALPAPDTDTDILTEGSYLARGSDAVFRAYAPTPEEAGQVVVAATDAVDATGRLLGARSACALRQEFYEDTGEPWHDVRYGYRMSCTARVGDAPLERRGRHFWQVIGDDGASTVAPVDVDAALNATELHLAKRVVAVRASRLARDPQYGKGWPAFVPLALSCVEPGNAVPNPTPEQFRDERPHDCRGTMTLTTRAKVRLPGQSRAKKVLLGRAPLGLSVGVPADGGILLDGGRFSVRHALALERLLRNQRVLSATLELRYRDALGTQRVERHTLTLRAPKRYGRNCPGGCLRP